MKSNPCPLLLILAIILFALGAFFHLTILVVLALVPALIGMKIAFFEIMKEL